MLRGDALDHATERFELVDILCIGQYRRRQAAGLPPFPQLVGRVEVVEQFRVSDEQSTIETASDCLSVRLKSGNGGFDDGTLLVTEHWGDLLKGKGPCTPPWDQMHERSYIAAGLTS